MLQVLRVQEDTEVRGEGAETGRVGLRGRDGEARIREGAQGRANAPLKNEAAVNSFEPSSATGGCHCMC